MFVHKNRIICPESSGWKKCILVGCMGTKREVGEGSLASPSPNYKKIKPERKNTIDKILTTKIKIIFKCEFMKFLY
jgi:hypothetical protein